MKARQPRPERRYEVAVTRAGVTRSSVFGAADARQTVHEAVGLGLVVSLRELPPGEVAFPGIRERAAKRA